MGYMKNVQLTELVSYQGKLSMHRVVLPSVITLRNEFCVFGGFYVMIHNPLP